MNQKITANGDYYWIETRTTAYILEIKIGPSTVIYQLKFLGLQNSVVDATHRDLKSSDYLLASSYQNLNKGVFAAFVFDCCVVYDDEETQQKPSWVGLLIDLKMIMMSWMMLTLAGFHMKFECSLCHVFQPLLRLKELLNVVDANRCNSNAHY